MAQELPLNRVATAQHPTLVALRMRIAETRILQRRVAAKLDMSDGHLSNILAGRTRHTHDAALLARIAQAIEDVASEAVA